MHLQEILDYIAEEKQTKEYVKIPDKIFAEITDEKAKEIASIFGENTLMKLPRKEIKFFKWLKENDRKVWDDLWEKDELGNDPYIVGMAFVPVIVRQNRGYPICDLLSNDNYYFTESHMFSEESKALIETAKTRFVENQKLDVHQLLALEISLDAIDIWRFAYNHSIDLDDAKKAVETLKKDNALVHIKNSEHLSNFVEF